MQIIQDRRALHRIPELDRDLSRTLAYLQSSLEDLNCRVFSPTPHSLCAFFDFGKPDAIAFRADMDALPITEKTGLSFASTHPGKMHACGHDGHMAIVLELARRLSIKKGLAHNVLLVFQHAEETTGGAKEICESGVFARYHVSAIFALHLWPGQGAGILSSRPGGMMCRSSEVNIDITGKSVHIAKATQGLDATAAAAMLFLKAAQLESSLPEDVFRVLKFGKLESGTVRNAVSGHARLEGSLRACEDCVFDSLRDGLLAIGREVEDATGCTVRIRLNEGYPAVTNPPDLYEKVKKTVDFEDLSAPVTIAEDFSWYQKNLPGMFFFLGTGDSPALHTDHFNFDESILVKGADFFEKLAEKFR